MLLKFGSHRRQQTKHSDWLLFHHLAQATKLTPTEASIFSLEWHKNSCLNCKSNNTNNWTNALQASFVKYYNFKVRMLLCLSLRLRCGLLHWNLNNDSSNKNRRTVGGNVKHKKIVLCLPKKLFCFSTTAKKYNLVIHFFTHCNLHLHHDINGSNYKE